MQRGIDLGSLDASWISSMSWYFIGAFGMRGMCSFNLNLLIKLNLFIILNLLLSIFKIIIWFKSVSIYQVFTN